MTERKPEVAPAGRQVAKDTFYYMLAAFLPQVAGFVLLPLFSRYLSPEDYGILGLLQVFATLLPLIWTLQINAGFSRYFFEYTGRDLKEFLSTLSAAMAALSLVAALASYAALPWALPIFLPEVDRAYAPLFTLTLATVFFGNLASLFSGFLRVRQQARLFMGISLGLFLAGAALNILEVAVLRRQARGMVEANLAVSVLSLLAYGGACAGFLVPAFRLDMVRKSLAYSLPLIPHGFFNLIFVYSDRVILAKYLPLAVVGLYTFSDRVASLFKMAVMELNNAFQPHFFKAAKADREAAAAEAAAIAKTTVAVVCLGISGFALFSAEATDLLLDDRYFATWRMMPWLASAWVFRSLYTFSTSGLFFDKKTGSISAITMVAAALNLGINFALIPVYGVWAAIASTVLSLLSTFVMAEILSRKVHPLPLNYRAILGFIAFMFASIAASGWLNGGYRPGSFLPPGHYAMKFGILAVGAGMAHRAGLLDLRRILALKRQ